jgi:DNA-binding transcriptional LysR family regulator
MSTNPPEPDVCILLTSEKAFALPVPSMDLHGIDLNLLVAFDALMTERSVTRAGARIGRTQPAMSAALSRLRALLRDELFVRSPSGLQPTPRALDLAEPLSHALRQIQRTLEFTQEFDPAASAATVTVGLSEHPTFVLLPRIVSALRTEAPKLTLRVQSFTARDEAIELLDAGKIDMAIGVPPTATGRILTRPLFEERFMCILRKEGPSRRAETAHPRPLPGAITPSRVARERPVRPCGRGAGEEGAHPPARPDPAADVCGADARGAIGPDRDAHAGRDRSLRSRTRAPGAPAAARSGTDAVRPVLAPAQ